MSLALLLYLVACSLPAAAQAENSSENATVKPENVTEDTGSELNTAENATENATENAGSGSNLVTAENATENATENAGSGSNLVTVEAPTGVCNDYCPEYADLEDAFAELSQTDQGTDLATQCELARTFVDVMYCLLQGDGSNNATAPTCSIASDQIKVLSQNCKLVGQDLLIPLEVSSYTATRCTLCSPMVAATRRTTYVGLLQCEELCSEDFDCRGFDFDTTRNLCRMWGSCPPEAQEDHYGCQWTTYERPADQIPTRAPTTTPADGGNTQDEVTEDLSENETVHHQVLVADASRFSASCTFAAAWLALSVLL